MSEDYVTLVIGSGDVEWIPIVRDDAWPRVVLAYEDLTAVFRLTPGGGISDRRMRYLVQLGFVRVTGWWVDASLPLLKDGNIRIEVDQAVLALSKGNVALHKRPGEDETKWISVLREDGEAVVLTGVDLHIRSESLDELDRAAAGERLVAARMALAA